MARTQAQHARRIERTLHKLHKALDAHHEALAEYAREYGEAAGVDHETMQTAAAPKKGPPNP